MEFDLSQNIAKVVIDSPLPHLDHSFDYLIPDNLLDVVKPGIRVRVPFRNRRVDGYVMALSETSEVSGKLSYLENIVSSEVILTSEIAQLCRIVAQRTVGNLHDVLRAAVPPRHARAEKRVFEKQINDVVSDFTNLKDYPDLIDFLNSSQKQIAIMNTSVTDRYSAVITTLIEQGLRNVLILFPDQFDVAQLLLKLDNSNLRSQVAVITSQQAAEQRYGEFLKVLRGFVNIVIGTRSAVFAPMNSIETIIIVDDGDDLYTSPQAPYWNARDVALWRRELFGTKLILMSHATSVEGFQLVESNQAVLIDPNKKARQDIVGITGDTWVDMVELQHQSARFPASVFTSVRKGLKSGSVLVSVPRKGYLTLIACNNCRIIVRCPRCNGAMSSRSYQEAGQCLRCGGLSGSTACDKCGETKYRALISGIERTTEEFGKAFPNVKVRSVDNENRASFTPDSNQLILATPGMEPVMPYAAVVVLDAYLFLAIPEGNARIRFLRHLMNLRSMLTEGGEMIVVGESNNDVLQAFIQNDPGKIARELFREREQTKLNPFARTAEIRGSWEALSTLAKKLPDYAQVWGPVPVSRKQTERHEASMLISVPRNQSIELVKSLKSWVVARSANRESAVMVRIDPDDI